MNPEDFETPPRNGTVVETVNAETKHTAEPNGGSAVPPDRLLQTKLALNRSLKTVILKFAELKHRAPSLAFIREKFPAMDYHRVFVLVSSMSVRFKIAGTLILVLALAIASLGMVTFARQKKLLESEMKKRAGVLVQQLANVGKDGLLTKEDLGIYSTIKDIQKNGGVVYAMVMDGSGKVFVHNSLGEKGRALSGEADLNALASSALLFQNVSYEGEPALEAALPIVTKAGNIRLGTARIGLSEKELKDAVRRQKIIFSLISLGFVAIGLLISFGLSRVLTQPIYTLAIGMQVVSRGDLSQQVKVFYKDEIGKLTESFNQMILSLREKLHMEKYLSSSVMQSIRKRRDSGAMKLGGERKYVTALFSDVRGFTSMSEKMSPEEVVDALNVYLNLQGKVVRQRGGAVDKFVGDEVMAIFEGKGQEVNAIRAAMDIQRYCSSLNQARAKSGKKQMQVGIGLNSGEVVMGNMGSEEHMDYTVIGDNINLAARLCSAAEAGQVVISKAVADTISKDTKLRKLAPVQVKGKDKPIEIFEVVDVSAAARRYMRKEMETGVTYQLAGLGDEMNQAFAKNLGPAGCLLEMPVAAGVGTKLSLELTLPSIPEPVKTDAVVKHAKKFEGRYYAGVWFEDLSEKDKNRIIEWVHQVESEIIQSS
ncbi:MAG: hypothetical protein A3A86_08200 [Elusimicrobia bacterium RIFCSPLOWO2_01_FULL_60_11]|nr:MAG: hypothetical protein A3A86_08200 [Elusimicrobia bacterium RIFCSPLOWO2_01_FULL_60_11]